MKNALSPLRKFGERIFGGGVNTLLNATERPSTAFSDRRESKTTPGAYMPLNAPTGGNKGICKRLISGALAAVMLITLSACSSNEETAKTATPDTSQQQAVTETSQPTEQSEPAATESAEPDKFGDMLDPFQGEWKRADTDSDAWRLIITGSKISDVGYDNDGNVSEIVEYEFDLDETGSLIVTQYGKPKYVYTIDDNGQLVSEKNGTSLTAYYEKVSDVATVPDAPEEKLEPAIGMTESEVYASSWGAPQKKNTTTTAAGEREQWVYEDGYIYFENGIVTAIQD